MPQQLWILLGIPLLLASLISIAAHQLWPADGFFLNLATEFIGILITISCVDWIIRRHEEARFAPLDSRIADRLRSTLNATVNNLGTQLRIEMGKLDIPFSQKIDTVAAHKQVMIRTKKWREVIEQHVLKLDQNDWKQLYSCVYQQLENVRDIRKTFNERFSPVQKCDLLDLEDALANSMTAYVVFPELMGIPSVDNERRMQVAWCGTTAGSLRTAIDCVARLSDSLPDQLSAKN